MVRLSCIVAIIGIALACVLAEEELYSSQYDDIDIKGILANDKLRKQYFMCFLGDSPCRTADAKFFKDIIGEALRTQCNKCTEKQKQNLDTLVDWYVTNDPENWQAFVAKTMENIQNKNAQ